MIGWAKKLRSLGIMGINQRNADFIMPYNPRHEYPLVDDKIRTKLLAIENNIAVPQLYCTVEIEHDVRTLFEKLHHHKEFVIKPAHGSGGNGVLVISNRVGERFSKPNGDLLSAQQVERHTSNILSGMYSLGGVPDKAIVEYRVHSDDFFEHISYQGVPDIRVIVFRGIPVASMIRLPTRSSDGKANLHQGAVGVGIRLKDGITMGGVYGSQLIDTHPDTFVPISGLELPHWNDILKLAARCSELVGLQYIGVDIVIDRERGPLVLEFNARPGLNVQLAVGSGLLNNLKQVKARSDISEKAEERVAFAVENLH